MGRYDKPVSLPPPDFRNQPIPDFVDRSKLPEVEDEQYPNNAVTENERTRFRLALFVAQQQFPDEQVMIWQVAHTIYNDPVFTTDE